MLRQQILAPGMAVARFGRRVVLPVCALVIGAIGLVVAFVVISAARQDTIALEASKRLARTALTVKEREIGRNLKDYAVWEDAYKSLHVNLDLEWASTDGNVGANILSSLGYEMALVVAPGNRTVYAVLDGEPTHANALQLFPTGLAEMLQEAARQAEPVVGLLRSGSHVVIVAASAIRPPEGLGKAPPPEARSMLIFAKTINEALLTRISDEYLLRDLKFVEEPGRQSAALPLLAPTGAALGHIVWTPEKPGRELLRYVLPPLLFALAGLSLFAWLALRNARHSARTIEEAAHTIESYAKTLESSEARFKDVAEASSDWIWETDPELRLTYLSTRFSEVTGVAAASVLGRTLDQFFSSETESDALAHLRGDTNAQSTFRDIRCSYRNAEGATRVWRLAGRPIRGKEGEFLGYRGTATDITSEVEAHARANHLALHDALTQLPNRLLLRDRLHLALAASQRDA